VYEDFRLALSVVAPVAWNLFGLSYRRDTGPSISCGARNTANTVANTRQKASCLDIQPRPVVEQILLDRELDILQRQPYALDNPDVWSA